jgi:hypothetical protein
LKASVAQSSEQAPFMCIFGVLSGQIFINAVTGIPTAQMSDDYIAVLLNNM